MWRPGRNFRVGAMRERITVQMPTVRRDAAGQPVTVWLDRLSDEPAAYHVTGGGTNYRGQQLAENVAAVFVVRYREGYTASDRIVHQSNTFGVTLVRPVDGGRRYLELMCRAISSTTMETTP